MARMEELPEGLRKALKARGPSTMQGVALEEDVIKLNSPLPVKEKVIEDSIKVQLTSSTSSEAIVSRTDKPAELSSEWERLDFPSNLIPYKIPQIWVRRFNVEILEKVYAAVAAKNSTGYIDALDDCISCDIRNLTVPDYIYFQYWLRTTSFPRSPYLFEWTSRYGNDNVIPVAVGAADAKDRAYTKIDIKFLEMTKSEYAEWQSLGIEFPTLREYEYISDEIMAGGSDATENKKMWILQNAQYVKIADDIPAEERMKVKIETLRQSVDLLSLAQDFAEKAEHGLVESLKIKDAKFNAKLAVDFLKKSAADIRGIIAAAASNEDAAENMASLLSLAESANDMETESEEILKCIAEDKTYNPREEVITLRSISAMDMFPGSTFREAS